MKRASLLAVGAAALLILTGCVASPPEPVEVETTQVAEPEVTETATPTPEPEPTPEALSDDEVVAALHFSSEAEERYFLFVLPHLEDELDRIGKIEFQELVTLDLAEAQALASSSVDVGQNACHTSRSMFVSMFVDSGLSSEYAGSMWDAAVVSGICD